MAINVDAVERIFLERYRSSKSVSEKILVLKDGSLFKSDQRLVHWEFGLKVLKNPELLLQLNNVNLLRMISLALKLDEGREQFIEGLISTGWFDRLVSELEGRLEKKNALFGDCEIDFSFDFRADTPPNRDPDLLSETLKKYHKKLWSKHLSNGYLLDLRSDVAGNYLRHSSVIGDFNLTSDCITHTYRNTKRMSGVIRDVDVERLNYFFESCFTIGGYIVFPGGARKGLQTINQSRGCNRRVADRFDLTLECIRRQYLGGPNPLCNTLSGYWDFFELFDSFEGYVQFFLLQDLVSDDFKKVNFYLPFDGNFSSTPLPKSTVEYYDYMEGVLEFLEKRNARMAKYLKMV